MTARWWHVQLYGEKGDYDTYVFLEGSYEQVKEQASRRVQRDFHDSGEIILSGPYSGVDGICMVEQNQ